MKRRLALLLAFAAVAVTGSAAAEEPKKTVEVLPVTRIAARPPRPSVVIQIARAEPQLGVRDLKRSTVDRIERAITRAPF